MKLVFFGVSGGVQSAASGNVSFAVRHGRGPGGFSALVEANGSPVQALKAAGIEPATLDLLVVTHVHTDHLYAAPSMVHNLWLMKRRRPLVVLANPPTRDRLRELLDLFGLLSREGMFEIRWEVREEGELRAAPGCAVRLFPVRHSVPTSGVAITCGRSRLVYSSDTGPAESVLREAAGARVLVHEASGPASRERVLNAAGHSSARQAGQAAAAGRVRRLFLCHLEAEAEAERAALLDEARSAFGGETEIPEVMRAYEI